MFNSALIRCRSTSNHPYIRLVRTQSREIGELFAQKRSINCCNDLWMLLKMGQNHFKTICWKTLNIIIQLHDPVLIGSKIIADGFRNKLKLDHRFAWTYQRESNKSCRWKIFCWIELPQRTWRCIAHQHNWHWIMINVPWLALKMRAKSQREKKKYLLSSTKTNTVEKTMCTNIMRIKMRSWVICH